MKVVILGNGIAGTNAARHIRKRSADAEILMISDETLRPFSRTALMYVFMGHVPQAATELYEDWFWAKNRIDRVFGRVEKADFEAKKLFLKSGEAIEYDFLILATGSIPNKFGWPGQDLAGVQGLYHLQDLESMEAAAKSKIRRAVVVGGGLIGIEMAEMWHSRGVSVTFLVREKSFWDVVLPAEESAMVNRHILEHGIDLRLGEELLEIEGDEKGHARGILAKNSGERIDCDFVGLTVGVRPNVDFLKGSGLEIGRGILVNQYLKTSEDDVFAIGDCAELRMPLSSKNRRAIEAVWYTGRMMGQTVARTVCGEPTLYDPGVWFNSAKFFDIEYQVYGHVPAQKEVARDSIYWEHPAGKKSIRVYFSEIGGDVLGFQTMGIRFRHEVCERWILEKTPVETVLKNLSNANFDPEFFERHEGELLKIFESKKYEK